jgi:quercetin dioxygenase-like cupin family protein
MDNKVIALESIQEETAGTLTRRVLVTPPRTGNRNLRVVYVTGQPGARGRVHTHPGEEALFTIQGSAAITVDGERHILAPNTIFVVPPHLEHPLEVLGDSPWIAVASFCDDCPLMANVPA